MTTKRKRPGGGLPASRRAAGLARALRYGMAMAVLSTAGCRSEMYDQPKYKANEPSTFFEDGSSNRLLVEGTVARGSLGADDYFARGMVEGKAVDEFPFEVTRVHLERGQQRYNIYCAPCHGQTGNGNGMIVQRGFPAPPPLYGPVMRKSLVDGGPVATYNDLRDAPAGHFVNVIANGHGVMYSYASRVGPEDRWNIAAYIRALQLSQSAKPEQLAGLPNASSAERKSIEEAAR